MTNHKNYYTIPVFTAIVLIPQVLFFWLTPGNIECYFAVYIGLTLLTAGISTVVFLLYRFYGLRRTAGTAAAGLFFELAAGIIAAALVSLEASLRSAIFAYILLLLSALVFMIPLAFSIINSVIDPPEVISPHAWKQTQKANEKPAPPPIPSRNHQRH